jgi:hypothetical protein
MELIESLSHSTTTDQEKSSGQGKCLFMRDEKCK